jgi:hypothetical protein
MKYKIDYDYEHGHATLYTSATPPAEAIERFYHLANQCFGIRKSIGEVQVISTELHNGIPAEWKKRFRSGVELLTHHGDVAIWNAKGRKIKSEFDN